MLITLLSRGLHHRPRLQRGTRHRGCDPASLS